MTAITNPEALLRAAHHITLVDWISPDIPRSLIVAGLTVVSAHHVANTANAISLCRGDLPEDVEADRIARLEGDNGEYLVFRSMTSMPARTDIVNVFRPAEEIPDIARLAIQLGASALWLPPRPTTNQGPGLFQ